MEAKERGNKKIAFYILTFIICMFACKSSSVEKAIVNPQYEVDINQAHKIVKTWENSNLDYLNQVTSISNESTYIISTLKKYVPRASLKNSTFGSGYGHRLRFLVEILQYEKLDKEFALIESWSGENKNYYCLTNGKLISVNYSVGKFSVDGSKKIENYISVFNKMEEYDIETNKSVQLNSNSLITLFKNDTTITRVAMPGLFW